MCKISSGIFKNETAYRTGVESMLVGVGENAANLLIMTFAHRSFFIQSLLLHSMYHFLKHPL